MHPRRPWAAALLTALYFAATSGPALGAVETVEPDNIDALITGSRGLLVVSLSSTDPKCQPCARANSKFQVLALGSNAVRYVQVGWQPWAQFPGAVRRLLAHYQLPMSTPIRLAFQDGQLVDRLLGEPPTPPQPQAFPETGRVEVIGPLDAERRIEGSKGLTIVMLSSFDSGCAFCMRANPLFEQLAGNGVPQRDDVKFLRVMYRPWTSLGSDAYGKALGANGLPVFLAYRDGKLLQRVNGIDSLETLRSKLLGDAR